MGKPSPSRSSSSSSSSSDDDRDLLDDEGSGNFLTAEAIEDQRIKLAAKQQQQHNHSTDTWIATTTTRATTKSKGRASGRSHASSDTYDSIDEDSDFLTPQAIADQRLKLSERDEIGNSNNILPGAYKSRSQHALPSTASLAKQRRNRTSIDDDSDDNDVPVTSPVVFTQSTMSHDTLDLDRSTAPQTSAAVIDAMVVDENVNVEQVKEELRQQNEQIIELTQKEREQLLKDVQNNENESYQSLALLC